MSEMDDALEEAAAGYYANRKRITALAEKLAEAVAELATVRGDVEELRSLAHSQALMIEHVQNELGLLKIVVATLKAGQP